MAPEDRLDRALRVLGVRRGVSCGGFPAQARGGTGLQGNWGPKKPRRFKLLPESVPSDPAVPGSPQEGPQREGADDAEERFRRWEERAAIIEFDGGFDRAEAEARATAELGFRPKR